MVCGITKLSDMGTPLIIANVFFASRAIVELINRRKEQANEAHE